MADNRKHSRIYYFTVSQGLRGCYMPDSCYIIQAKTRRELRAALEWEASYIREAFDAGCSKRAVSWLANAAWKARKRYGLPYVAEYGNRSGSSVNYCFGLQCATASREEWNESQKEML